MDCVQESFSYVSTDFVWSDEWTAYKKHLCCVSADFVWSEKWTAYKKHLCCVSADFVWSEKWTAYKKHLCCVSADFVWSEKWTAYKKHLCCVSADFVWSDEWVEYRGHTYKYFDDGTITGVRAHEECRKKGTLLVSINDAEEADFIAISVLRKRTLSAFIGATDNNTGT